MFGRFSQLGLVLCLAAGLAAAQDKKNAPPPTPKPAPKSSPPRENKVWSPPATPRPPRAVHWGDGITSEKAIAADPGVAIKFCISEGDVKINGTERDELRVFVRNGRKFEFRSLEKDAKSGKATWVWLTRASDERAVPGPFTNCLSGENIEIDIPLKGSVTIEGRSGTVEIDSVAKATVKLIEGDVTVRNIPSGLDARTDQGELFAENIGGHVALETTSGNIVAFDLRSSRPDDPLKVKTLKGTISLQKIAHRQIDANALSGSVNYVGNFLGGGIYKFRSSSGRIGLLLPEDVDCRIHAAYGFGSFDSAFSLKVVSETIEPGGKSMVAALGAGKGPMVMLSTTSGVIRIRKQGQADLP
ncbi:MAG TPA: DUF4097 family beta strand repeat-containing protein [Pyrinomonadaceae bacterium]